MQSTRFKPAKRHLKYLRAIMKSAEARAVDPERKLQDPALAPCQGI